MLDWLRRLIGARVVIVRDRQEAPTAVRAPSLAEQGWVSPHGKINKVALYEGLGYDRVSGESQTPKLPRKTAD